MKKIIQFFFVGTCILSCQGDTKNNKLILGKWQGISWESNGKPLDRNVQTTKFVFTNSNTYTFENNGNIQYGTYKVENDNLFTTPKNELEMMVKIATISNDTLVFDMNRSGLEERLTLIKEK